MDSNQQKKSYHCPLCGRNLTGKQHILHWDGRDEMGNRTYGDIFEAQCTHCGIDLTKDFGPSKSSEWSMTEVQPSYLIKQLGALEVEAITKKLARYKNMGSKWKKFLSQKRPDDEIWGYRLPSDETTGAALIRNGTPIASYQVSLSL